MNQQQAEDPEKIHDRALRLLSYRSRSVSEMRDRLTRAGFVPDLVEGEIARLLRVDLLNDDRFAVEFAHDATEVRRQGRRVVAMGLVRKGVDADTVEAITASLTSEAEEARALGLAQRRAPRLRDLDSRVAYGRLSGFLLRRGFDGDVVREVCRAVLTDPADEALGVE